MVIAVTTPAVTEAVKIASTPPPTPTSRVIVSVVNATISNVWPAAGSVALGYGWSDVKLSLEHLNTNELLSRVTVFAEVNPWLTIVNVSKPVSEI